MRMTNPTTARPHDGATARLVHIRAPSQEPPCP
jgi:hypothetical protein